MYYYIFGEDTYRSRRKLKELTEDLEKTREVFYYDASIEDVREAEKHVRGNSLFGVAPGVVIYYPVDGSSENAEWSLQHLSEIARSEAVFIFWEGGEEKAVSRGKKKESIKKKTSEEQKGLFEESAKKTFSFPVLANSALEKYIHERAAERATPLSQKEAQDLAFNFGGNLWAIDHELEKYALTGSFDYRESEALQEKLYDFLDALCDGNRARAFELFHGARTSGFESIYILASLAGTLRNMLKVKSILPTNPDYQKMEEFGMHPFVLKKTLSQVRRFRIDDLKRLYVQVEKSDRLLKSTDAEEENVLYALLAGF